MDLDVGMDVKKSASRFLTTTVDASFSHLDRMDLRRLLMRSFFSWEMATDSMETESVVVAAVPVVAVVALVPSAFLMSREFRSMIELASSDPFKLDESIASFCKMITVPKHRIHIVPTTMRNLVVVLSLLPFPFDFGSTILSLLLTLTRKEKNEVENEEIAKKLFV